ncbi:MAG TPA: SLC13 family permease [Thermoanaerobaculia bacterium]|nr:SLC13 family permease [Thermoanaerobaculia bacterium]
MIATLGRFAREQIVELIAAAAAAAFLLSGRVTWRSARGAVDTDLLLLLFALLVTVEVLRRSGYLDAAVAAVVIRFTRARAFAMAAVLGSGVLAAFLTNDVALFVIIPVTVIASRMSDFDVEDAVVLQVVAANLIGCLTPLGNPQNLFIYHQAGWSAPQFIVTMAPFVAWNLAGLVAATLLLGRSRPVVIAAVSLPARDGTAALAGAACFILVVLDIFHVIDAWVAATAALIAGIVFLGRRLGDVDLSIIPLFFFAFIVVEGLRTFDVVQMLSGNLYLMSVLLSQVISNVPAAILLTPIANGDWRELLYGVNAGGCGTIIASLANLLGWRIYVRESNRDPRFFWRLTKINFVFLAWAGIGGWLLL